MDLKRPVKKKLIHRPGGRLLPVPEQTA